MLCTWFYRRTRKYARRLSFFSSVSDFREPKVEDLGVAMFGDEDVRRLDITMDDVL